MKIEYISRDEFEPDYRSEIYAESETLIQEHLWWYEPLTLFDKIEEPLRLTGESELIRNTLNDEYGVRRVVEKADDVYLALIDYLKIVEVLEYLSAKHEIVWELFFRNTSSKPIVIGHIINGESESAVIRFVTDTLERYAIDEGSLWDEELKRAVYDKYFDAFDAPRYGD